MPVAGLYTLIAEVVDHNLHDQLNDPSISFLARIGSI